jgi:hypothetical protein
MNGRDVLLVCFLVAIAAGVSVGMYYWFHPKHRARRLMARLERQYLSTQPGSQREARERFTRQMARLSDEFPGKSRIWLLQRLLSEGKRAER